MMIRRYSELIKLPTFEERLNYLSIKSSIGIETFGKDRYINQTFYNSWAWRQVRNKIIIRDNGCDLGIPGRDIFDGIWIHHMNPATLKDFELENPELIDPEFLISTSLRTHNAIHYRSNNLIHIPNERRKGDTKLW